MLLPQPVLSVHITYKSMCFIVQQFVDMCEDSNIFLHSFTGKRTPEIMRRCHECLAHIWQSSLCGYGWNFISSCPRQVSILIRFFLLLIEIMSSSYDPLDPRLPVMVLDHLPALVVSHQQRAALHLVIYTVYHLDSSFSLHLHTGRGLWQLRTRWGLSTQNLLRASTTQFNLNLTTWPVKLELGLRP